jgi:hypothetical protein
MLNFNGADFTRQLENAAHEIERAVEEAAQAGQEAVAQRGLELKQEEVGVIYARPAPRGSRRTGALQAGQQIVRNGDALEVRTVGPAAEYEPYLKYPAAENAVERLEAEAPQVFERAVEDALRERLG